MRKMLFIVLSLLIGTNSYAQESIRMMTYNIKYDDRDTEGNGWAVRKPWVIGLIDYHAPAIFGLQEVLNNQVTDIDHAFPDHTFAGVGRDDGKRAGEYSPVFFDSTLFELIDSGTFWLSDTPGKVSRGWDAALPRICTYVKLRNSSGAEFVVYNAHFDHVGEEARRNSARVIMNHYRENNSGIPAVFMGDLNFTDDDPAYTHIIQSGFADSRKKTSSYGPKATYNAFSWEDIPQRRIDYIFINSGFDVSRFGVLTDSRDNRYPSDHFPVMVTVELR